MTFFGYIPNSRISGPYGNTICNFLRILHTVFHNGCTNLTFPLTKCKCSFFSASSPTIVAFYLFDESHSKCSKVVSHPGFDFHFPGLRLNISSYTCWPFVCLLLRNVL
jgi:hypothetical protein